MAGKAKPAVEEEDDLPGDPEPKAKKKPAPAPIVEEEDEPTPAPKKYAHTQRLTELARHLGYTQDEIDLTPDEALRQEIALLQTEMSRQTPTPKQEPKKPEPEPADEDEAYLAELEKDEQVDKRHVSFLKRQVAARKAAEAKVAKLDQFEEKEKQRDIQRANEKAERALTALGKKFESLIGVGDWDELTDPGQRGWRQEIFAKAGVDFTKDSQATINRKVEAAAKKLAGSKIKDDESEEEEASPYDQKPKKKAPAQDPETGRFTAEDFEKAKVAKPSGKKNTPSELDAVEATRELLRQNGDPRGLRPAISFDDDGLPD